MSNLRKLRKDLLKNYDPNTRPVKNASTPVKVRLTLQYISLFELDEKEERMVIDCVVQMDWYDEHLTWVKGRYKEVERIHFTMDKIWHPDLFILNGAPLTNDRPWNTTEATVLNIGWVDWWTPSVISTRCPMSSLKPMEERLCNISVGSYSHYRNEMVLELPMVYKEMLVLDNINNPIWEVMSVKLTTSNSLKRKDSVDYSVVTYTLKIRRRYDFTDAVTRGPRTIAILLTLSMFWIPSDKKMNLGCLVLLVLSGVILYLSSTVVIPSLLASTVTQLRITLFIATSALLVEVLILNLHRLSDIVKPTPTLIRILSGMVGRMIGVCSRLEYMEEGGMVRLPEIGDEEDAPSPSITIQEQWSLVAMALDRLFFFIYAIIFIIIS